MVFSSLGVIFALHGLRTLKADIRGSGREIYLWVNVVLGLGMIIIALIKRDAL